MVRLAWKERFSVHHEVIDAQHRGLLDLINALGELQGSPDPEAMAEVFHQLCSYALSHFATEERLLEEVQYPGLSDQVEEHASFIRQLLELNQRYEPGDRRLAGATYGFVRDWYLNHILDKDLAFAPFLSGSQRTP